MPTIDWTIHLSDVVLFLTLLVGAGKLILGQRDFNQEMKTTLGKRGTREIREGLLGDVQCLNEDMYESGGIVHKLRNQVSAHDFKLALNDKKRD